jgi:hypothetical protein
VTVQAETSLRQASKYPYDDYRADTLSLRTNTDEVRGIVQAELASRLEAAGVEILETQMAVAQLADSDLIELDPERKAAMVANLMVVLSGDHSPTPVIDTGSLYA